MADMSNIYSSGETSTMKEVASGIVEDVVDEVKEKAMEGNSWVGKGMKAVAESDLGKSISVAETVEKWYKLLHDLMTTSYVLFIGEIKLEINTGWDKYSFKANYDGNGERIGDPIYKKAYITKDMFTNLGYARYNIEGEDYIYHILEGEGEK